MLKAAYVVASFCNSISVCPMFVVYVVPPSCLCSLFSLIQYNDRLPVHLLEVYRTERHVQLPKSKSGLWQMYISIFLVGCPWDLFMVTPTASLNGYCNLDIQNGMIGLVDITFILGMETNCPVSYTHLDVYKRQ